MSSFVFIIIISFILDHLEYLSKTYGCIDRVAIKYSAMIKAIFYFTYSYHTYYSAFRYSFRFISTPMLGFF